MDSWFKKAEEVAQAAKARAEQLQEGASGLSAGVQLGGLDRILNLTNVSKGLGRDGRKDVEFLDSKMGFCMECTTVTHVEPNGQADRLGVAIGDRLVKVAGYEVPGYDFGDAEGEERAGTAALTMMKEMPPPVRLTFAPPASVDVDAEIKNQEIKNQAISSALDLDCEDHQIDDFGAWDDFDVDLPAEVDTFQEGLSAEIHDEAFAEAVNLTENAFAAEATNPTQNEPLAQDADETLNAPLAQAANSTQVPLSQAASQVQNVPVAQAASPAQNVPIAQVEGLQNALQRERGKRQKLVADLKEARGELKEGRQARATLLGNLEAEKRQRENHEKKAAELSEELECYRSQNAELLQERQFAASAEAAEIEAAAQARVTAANERVTAANERASQLQQQVDELTEQLGIAEERASASDKRLGQLSSVLEGFQTAHSAELEMLTKERDRLKQRICPLEETVERLTVAEKELTSQLESARVDLDEARRAEAKHREAAEAAAVDAQAALVEANAARVAAAEAEDKAKIKAAAEAASSAVESRAAAVEANAAKAVAATTFIIGEKPVVNQYQGAGAGQPIPAWLPCVQQYLGPTIGQVLVLVYTSVDGVLRALTQRLLNRGMWLWVFWIHMLVLYAFSGSCYLVAEPDPNTPHKRINAFIDKSGGSSPLGATGQVTSR